MGIEDSVSFVGRIDHDRLPLAHGAADVFVSVPSLDATSVSLLEAMASGNAIIASDLPSNREWIIDGINGFIVAPRNAEDLADRTADLLENPALRLQFGERCIEIAHERAGYVENMARVEKLCESLVERSGKSFRTA
jgi:glycosyltransferase involved in cell wall biosynthesis